MMPDAPVTFSNQHLLAEQLSHARRQHAGEHVEGAAGRERHHDDDGTVRIILRERGVGQRRRGRKAGEAGHET